MIVVVDSSPCIALSATGAAVPGALNLPVLTGMSPIRRPLMVPGAGSGESASASVDFDDADGTLARLLGETPPIRVPARVLGDDGEERFAGVVTEFVLGARGSLTIESGLAAPITDVLPLRSTVVWGGFRDVAAIPLVYGRTRLSPVPYDATGRVFVIADHPIEGVDGVWRDGAEERSFAHANATDSTGRAVAFLELADPLRDGARLTVAVRGKRHPLTGALIATPAEVLQDLLVRVCGVPLAEGRLDAFRSATADIEVGGVFADLQQSVRGAVDALLGSVGAAWSLGAPDVAFLYPLASTGGATLGQLDEGSADEPVSRCRYDDLATTLTLTWDDDYAEGKPRRALLLRCPEAIRRYGEIPREWHAGWIKRGRDAEALARRLLAHFSRPRWRVTWIMSGQLNPGDAVLVQHAGVPVAGDHRLLTADVDPGSLRLECALEAPVGPVLPAELVSLSTAFEPIQVAGAAIEYRDGQATITLVDDTGTPIGGAVVTLDGSVTHVADPRGRVSFAAARGKHQLHVEATGYAPMDIEVAF